MCIGLSTISVHDFIHVYFHFMRKNDGTTTEITIQDGLIYKQGELKPYTGFIKDTVEGKMIEYHVVEGKKSGEFKTYFKNGHLEMIGQIKDNLNQGKWIYYYQNGQVESEGTI